ncbi:MAG: response regulator [Lachnospiraceae bacterium]|nr:response regulator [Lachnospiraceae bacterium]
MKKIRVLLVENDNQTIIRLENMLKSRERVEIIGIAQDGLEAWKTIRNVQPEVIVMEPLLPYMDGFEIIDRIYTKDDYNPMIIVATMINNEAIVKEAFKKGIHYYVVKPYDEKMIFEQIKHIYFDNPSEEIGITYSIDKTIETTLNKLNFPMNLKGYQYLISAIKEVIADDEMLYGVTKVLYPKIAKKHQSTAIRVEKAIRHAIEVAWQRCDEEIISDFWKNNQVNKKRRPTNSELIAILSQRIRGIGI